jgi:hypothetical protein
MVVKPIALAFRRIDIRFGKIITDEGEEAV